MMIIKTDLLIGGGNKFCGGVIDKCRFYKKKKWGFLRKKEYCILFEAFLKKENNNILKCEKCKRQCSMEHVNKGWLINE